MGVLIQGKGGASQKPIIYSALQMSSSLKDVNLCVFWGQRSLGTNAIWYNDFQKHKQSAKGGKGGGKGTQYTYSAAVELALGRGIIDSIVNVWPQASTTSTTSLSELNMTFYAGTSSQVPPSFITSKYPSQARTYNHTAFLFCPKLDLGSSASIPDYRFECVRANGFYTVTSPGYKNPETGAVTNAIDVLLGDCLVDYLTNPVYGLGFSLADAGDPTQYNTYCRAQGLFFSPCLKTQEQVTSTIDRWAKLSNTWIYWSGTEIRYVPLGDSTITGNGVTYTPQMDVAYDVGPADFMDKNQPVKPTIKDPSDVMNRCAFAFTNRTIGYTNDPAEWKDQTLVDKFGLRDNASEQADDICNPAVAKIAVQLYGKRMAYVQRTYEFTLNYRFIRCLPGTILTLTEPNLGLDHFKVRVKEIEEDESTGNLKFTAEEVPQGIGTYYDNTNHAPATQNGFPSQLVQPGAVNTPAIIEPNSAFTGGKPVLIVAASGGKNWGGCDVYLSFDPTGNGNLIGTIGNPAVQGVLTSALADHADPDTTNTLAIDATESLTVPQTVSTADADALRTLSLIAPQPSVVGGFSVVPNNGELLAFGNVAATGTYSANLTYLRRGQYGTAHSAHSSGDQFTAIDVLGVSDTTLTYDLPPQYIGTTLYIRFVSFNVFQNSYEDISTVVAYQYTPTGAGYGGGTGGVPTMPTGFTSNPVNGANNTSWNSNPSTDNITSYKVYRATGLSQPFASATLVWQGLATSWQDTGVTSGGAYTYWLVAENAVGDSTPVSANQTSSTVTYSFRAVGGTPGRKPSGGTTTGEELFNAVMKTGDKLTSGLTGSLLACEVAPTSTWTMTLYKNGVSIGTGTINAAATTGTWTFASTVTFADGDLWTATAPATQDATLSGVAYSILGTRTQ